MFGVAAFYDTVFVDIVAGHMLRTVKEALH